MRNKGWAVILAAAVGLAGLAAPARGQFYIGLRGGASNQTASGSGGGGKIEFDKSSAFLYGAQAGFRLSALAIEGEIYRANHDLVETGGAASSPVGLDYYYLGVNVKLGLPLVIFYPYVTAGYGRYSAKLGGFGEGSDSGVNVGVGAELTIGLIGVFAEARYTDFGFNLADLTWDFGGVDVHAGLNIHF